MRAREMPNAMKVCCNHDEVRRRGSALRGSRGYANHHWRCSNRKALPVCVTRHSRQFAANRGCTALSHLHQLPPPKVAASPCGSASAPAASGGASALDQQGWMRMGELEFDIKERGAREEAAKIRSVVRNVRTSCTVRSAHWQKNKE